MACLTAFLKRETKEEQDRGDGEGDQGEVPVQPEHQDEHADDGQQVDKHVERGRGGEALNGLDVGGDSTEQVTDLVGIVVAEGEALQVMEGPHAEIVGNILAGTLSEVAVDVAGDGSNDCDGDDRQGGNHGEVHLVLGVGSDEAMQPLWNFVAASNVVDDDFERPRGGEGGGGLHHHGDEDDGQGAAVGADELANEGQHAAPPKRRRSSGQPEVQTRSRYSVAAFMRQEPVGTV